MSILKHDSLKLSQPSGHAFCSVVEKIKQTNKQTIDIPVSKQLRDASGFT